MAALRRRQGARRGLHGVNVSEYSEFSYVDGLDPMLENGSWFIRNNPLILKKWDPNVNLLIEDVVNAPVWVKLHGVPVTAFSEDGLSVIATKLDMSSYARSMIELRADVELKDTIVLAMPKIIGKGFYTCTIQGEYEWKPSRCACCKVFGHIQDECLKNLGSNVAKKSKIPSQAPRGVSVGPKVGFKPVKQLYRPVSKKNNVNTSGNNKNDMLNSVENNVDLGTNGGLQIWLVKKLIIVDLRSGMWNLVVLVLHLLLKKLIRLKD
ncbi:putative RNA-directed DNA polymerase [Tanacetum coccineum]